jgi:methylated-DNA-[protein]-cysteine S-methyltransferase
MAREVRLQIGAFSTELGWMALVAGEKCVEQIVCAHKSAGAAIAALDAALAERAEYDCDDWQWLVVRLQDFTAGRPVDFADVPIALDHLTPFQRRVVRHCRAIPYGSTLSYGGLAAKAGSPRAARAAGSTMAMNRFSLVVPCHRVINADGTPGRYGTPEGTRTKRRLLELEARGLEQFGRPKEPQRPGCMRRPGR